MTTTPARLAPAIPTPTQFQLGKPATSKRQPTRAKDRDSRIIMLVSSKAANNRAAKAPTTKARPLTLKELAVPLPVAELLKISNTNLTFLKKGLPKSKWVL